MSMKRLPRLLSMALMFSARRRLRAEDLATHFKITVRTVYRDVNALLAAGFPLVGTPGDGYSLTQGAQLKALTVTPDEAEALVLAARSLQQTADPRLEATLISGIAKLESVMPVEAVRRLKEHQAAVRFAPSRKAGPLSTILEAVHQRQVLALQYAGRIRGEVTRREVEPLGLVRLGSVWLVPAYCRLRNDARVFRTDLIQSATVTGEIFAVREGVTLSDLTQRENEMTPQTASALNPTTRAPRRSRHPSASSTGTD